jgi:hypothetical protein
MLEEAQPFFLPLRFLAMAILLHSIGVIEVNRAHDTIQTLL